MADRTTPFQSLLRKGERTSKWRIVRNRMLSALAVCGFALILWAIYGATILTNGDTGSQRSGARQISAHPNLSRVIDADTIVVGDIHVRLDGIAAPERGHEVYTKGKWFVEDLMQAATNVECDLEGRKSYEREVGACYFVMPDGRRVDPQAEAVKAGLARDCPRFSKGRYRDEEVAAVERGLNLSARYQLPPYCVK